MKRIAIVAGMGSIGQRHAQLLGELDVSVCTVSRRPGIGTFDNIGDAVQSYPEAILVLANETSSHMSDLRLARSSGHIGLVVVEKPLASHPRELPDAGDAGSVQVAYNLRFVPVVMALREALRQADAVPLAVRMHAGQHLGTWRPGRGSDESYSSYAEQGGGVLRDLSHELDLSCWLWGRTIGVCALGGRRSNVTVNSDDCWTILMKTAAGTDVALSLNYLDRPATRYIHLNTAQSTYQADLVRHTLCIDGEVTHFPSERNTSYKAMWSNILARPCHTGASQVCSFEEGAETVKLIADCEISARNKLWMSR